MKSRRFRWVKLLFLGSLVAVPLFARPAQLRADDSDAERARKAAAVLQEIMSAPDKGIPKELLDKATAIAVIPHDVRGAFFFGGSYGKGVVSEREKDGKWSAPSFIKLTGGSFGLQFGVSSTDYVLVFTNYEGIKPLLKGKLKLGADASVAAGPVGRTAGAATNILLESAIYTYSRSKGVFVGIALNGAYLGIDDDANRDIYGKNVTADDLLVKQDVGPTAAVEPFLQALAKYTPRTSGGD